jgi:hypothetical protein
MIMFYISFGCSYISGTAAFRIPWALQYVTFCPDSHSHMRSELFGNFLPELGSSVSET